MFFIDDEEFTKYGYYNVDGFKTLSKLEAWQLSKGNFNKIKFIYFLVLCINITNRRISIKVKIC